MSDLLREEYGARLERRRDAGTVEHLSAIKRQYVRAREYCGYTLDEIINNRAAKQYLREVWLIGCMVRKPVKATVLPPGNPFRNDKVLVIRRAESTRV
jgi:hypothetical protein